MVEAFMLIRTEVGHAELEYVTGPYDVMAPIGADTLGELQSDVVASVQQVTGIARTLTCPIPSTALS